jgi:hypothetical protein
VRPSAWRSFLSNAPLNRTALAYASRASSSLPTRAQASPRADVIVGGVHVERDGAPEGKPRRLRLACLQVRLRLEIHRVGFVGTVTHHLRVEGERLLDAARALQPDALVEPREIGGPCLVALALVAAAHRILEAQVLVAVVAIEPDARAGRAGFGEIEMRRLAHRREVRVRHEPQPQVPVLVRLERLVEANAGIREAAMNDARHRRDLAVVVHDERVHARVALDRHAMVAIESPQLRVHEPRAVRLGSAGKEASHVGQARRSRRRRGTRSTRLPHDRSRCSRPAGRSRRRPTLTRRTRVSAGTSGNGGCEPPVASTTMSSSGRCVCCATDATALARQSRPMLRMMMETSGAGIL